MTRIILAGASFRRGDTVRLINAIGEVEMLTVTDVVPETGHTTLLNGHLGQLLSVSVYNTPLLTTDHPHFERSLKDAHRREWLNSLRRKAGGY